MLGKLNSSSFFIMAWLMNVAIRAANAPLVALLVYQFYLLIMAFCNGGTFMVDSFVPQTETQIPEITYCLKSKIKNMPAFLESYNMLYANESWKNHFSSKEAFENATFSQVPRILKYFYVRYFEIDYDTNRHNWNFSKTNYEEAELYFKRRSHPIFGQCATFKISDKIKKLGMYYTKVETANDEKFSLINFIHDENNFWHTTLFKPGIVTNHAEQTEIQVNYEEVFEVPNGSNNCSDIGQDACFENHLEQKLFSDGPSCLPPWIDINGLPYCTSGKEISEADQILKEAIYSFDKYCKRSCHSLEITSGSRNIKSLAKSQMVPYLYFPVRVQCRVETYFMSGLKLVAELGGYAGLLLGMSFFHVVNLATYIIDWYGTL